MMVDIFIPVYNEGKKIDNIRKIFSALNPNLFQFRIIIVNDNSNDKTLEKLNIMKDEYNFDIVDFNKGPSRRENLAEAMNNSDADYVMFMDFDLATDISALQELLKGLKEGYDIVIGSRYIKGSFYERKWYRLFISKIYNFFIRFYFGSKVYDHQCGFKAMNAHVFKKIKKEMGYDYKFKRGWFWDAEFLIRAQKKGFKIKEIPIKWKFGKDSSFSFKREMRMIPYILSLRFKL